jgi:DNA polymerase I-like protein with 3'-5' exonuclease and polymerase domains
MKEQIENIIVKGSTDCELIVITDTPLRGSYEENRVMPKHELALFAEHAKRNGFSPKKTAFITPSAPMPKAAASTEKKVGEFLSKYHDAVHEAIAKFSQAKLLMYFGKDAGRQFTGRPVKITQACGSIDHLDKHDFAVLPMLSPRNVLRRPHLKQQFETDFLIAGTYRESDWKNDVFEGASREAKYEWRDDLQFLIDMYPKKLVVDTETVGLKWFADQRVLCVQFCWAKGKACAVPFDVDYGKKVFDEDFSQADVDKLVKQTKKLLGNRKTKTAGVVGHNFKFDLHALKNFDIDVANFAHETMQLAYTADDNMESKSLDHCVRRWVPEMAGYADEFNKSPVHQRKSRMDLVAPDDMLFYGCGDVDATFRLCKNLLRICREDSKNFNVYQRVKMPAIRKTFFECERNGYHVDRDALMKMRDFVFEEESRLYTELIQEAPAAVKRRWLNLPKEQKKTPREVLSFTRDSFTVDVLFSEDGFNLTPVVFTDSTKNLEPYEDKDTGESIDPRIPSASIKTHLPLFDHSFVDKLIEYKKILKYISTYVGSPESSEKKTVKLLKSRKYPKAVQDIFANANVELPVIPKKNEVSRLIRLSKQVKIKPVEIITGVAKSDDGSRIDYAKMDNNTIMRKIVTPDSGFFKYLSEDGKIYPSLHLHRTVTGRTSSSDPNAQNFPKRGEMAKLFRSVFKPRPGWVMLECDLSQIELRIAAWMANESTMLQIYRDGGDIHAYTGANVAGIDRDFFMTLKGNEEVFDSAAVGYTGRPLDGVDTMGDFFDRFRYYAKAVNFGFIYGMWWVKFKDYAKTDYQIELKDREAEAMRESFFESYPGLNDWHWNMKNFAEAHGYVRSLHGGLRRLPDIYSNDEAIQGEAKRQAINAPVQHFASDLGVMGLNRFTRDCPKEVIQPIGFVHDAGYIQAREDYAMEAAASIKFYMETNPLQAWFNLNPPIPLTADVSGPADNMASMKEIEALESYQPDWYRADLDAA